MTWTLSENKKSLSTPAGIEVPLEAEPFEVVPCGDLAVVFLNLDQRSDSVVAIKPNGTVAWRFVPMGRWYGVFTGGWCDGDTVRLYSSDGLVIHVDLTTGKQIKIEQAR